MARKLPTVYGSEDIKKRGSFDINSPRIKFILKNIENGVKILDIGCFLGHYTNAFAKKGYETVGIDVCSEVIEAAKRNYPYIRFECIDAMELLDYFQNEKFDVVIASEVIEHVLDPDIFLQNIRGILKQNGKLILTTQNSNAIQYRLRMLIGRFRWDFSHFRIYSKQEIVNQLKRNGYIIKKVKVLPITKTGSQKFLRLFAYYSSRIYPNFGWTTGVIATSGYYKNS